jgi:hypothetical protein
MIVPHLFEHHRPGDNLPLVAKQQLEKPEFARLQVDALARAFDAPRQQIHVEIAASQARDDRLGTRRTAALERLNPGKELGKSEWLREIIVRPALQALHPLVGRAERRKHDDRRVDPRCTHCSEHREPVHSGQHPIKHDRRIMAVGRVEEPVPAVAGDIDDIAVLLEALGDIVRSGRVIFDDENLLRHALPPSARVNRAGSYRALERSA